MYNFSQASLERNVKSAINFYNSQVDAFMVHKSIEALSRDPQKFSWDRADWRRLAAGTHYAFDASAISVSMYRPYSKLHSYVHRDLNNAVYKIPTVFRAGQDNLGIMLTSPSSHYPTFAALMTDQVPDVHLVDTGQLFPRYVYDSSPVDGGFAMFDGPQRRDNITDGALARYQQLYGADVAAGDVFFGVYGLLHSEDYRRDFAADLKKMLPRIPELTDPVDFRAFADAGRALSDLHIGYESANLYPVELSGPIPGDLRVTKMRYGGKAGSWNRTVIHVAPGLVITGIPIEAHEYKLGSRSAIDWILERYQVKTDKASGIVNDPNDWGAEHDNPAYVVELIQRIVTVSMETQRIVKALPPLRYRGRDD
jgi:predicted helicase